jgi:hypothetical protein
LDVEIRLLRERWHGQRGLGVGIRALAFLPCGQPSALGESTP